MCDILDLGGKVAQEVARISHDTDAFRIDMKSAPILPNSMTTESILVKCAYHAYDGCWRVDQVNFFATRQTLRAFGVIVLASLFAEPDHVTEIALTHPETDISLLRLKTPPMAMDTLLARRPVWYDYWPEKWSKHPWSGKKIDPYNLPAAYLTDRDEIGGVNEAQWNARDTIVGFGAQEGVARFGQFLLDIGDHSCSQVEYHLESEAGFRGVAPMSAELSIWLPGSIAWQSSYGLDDL